MRLVATGDSVVTRRVSQLNVPQIRAVAHAVRSADVSFTNLELVCPVPTPVPAPSDHPHLAAPAWAIDELMWYGFRLFNIAHNHAADFTPDGLLRTIQELERRSLTYAGGGRDLNAARAPAFREAGGTRVALVAATSSGATQGLASIAGRDVQARPGVSPLRFRTRYTLDETRYQALAEIDEALGTRKTTKRRQQLAVHADTAQAPDGQFAFFGRSVMHAEAPGVTTDADQGDLHAICESIRAARADADIVLLSLHCHEGRVDDWNSDTPADFIGQAARLAIDAGADAVIGHGPHMLRAVELYKGKPILYSLGNFAFMLDTMSNVPPETYAMYGLPPDAGLDELARARWQTAAGEPRGFEIDERFWESVICEIYFGPSSDTELVLRPIVLGRQGAERGVPMLAEGTAAEQVLTRLRDLSQELGTHIDLERDRERVTGHLRL